MTADQQALIAHYLPLITNELRRIGLTDDDFFHLGSGGEITEAMLQAQLTELETIPSGIGAQAYFARFGVDFAAVKRDATRHLGSDPASDAS